MKRSNKIGINVYGYDLDADGSLGKGTIRRLKVALKCQQNTGGFLVASAWISPDIPEQVEPMAEMIRAWFLAKDTECRVVEAKTFDTEGERDAFLSCEMSIEIHVSSWWHLIRIWILRKQRPEMNTDAVIKYLPVWDVPSLKSGILEVGKIAACNFPQSWQDYLRIKIKKRVRTSY